MNDNRFAISFWYATLQFALLLKYSVWRLRVLLRTIAESYAPLRINTFFP